MIVQSFRSVLWVGAVASAAIGCYMVSLRVAAERASLERVEMRILLAKRDIRALDTELVTRGRVRQLERWNVDVLALSAPTEGQFLDGEVELASLTAPRASVGATTMMAAAEDVAATDMAAKPIADAPVAESMTDDTHVRPIIATYTPPEEKARNPLLVRASAPAPAPAVPRERDTAPAPVVKRAKVEVASAKVGVAKASATKASASKAGATKAGAVKVGAIKAAASKSLSEKKAKASKAL